MAGAGLTLSAAAAVLETIQAEGCNGSACPRANLYHGHPAAARVGGDEGRLPAADRLWRASPAGLRRHRAGQRHRYGVAGAPRPGARAENFIVDGQKVWTSRAEHSDLMLLLARTSPAPEGGRKTAGLSTLLVDMRDSVGRGLTIKPIRTMMNQQQLRGFLRQSAGPRLPIWSARKDKAFATSWMG